MLCIIIIAYYLPAFLFNPSPFVFLLVFLHSYISSFSSHPLSLSLPLSLFLSAILTCLYSLHFLLILTESSLWFYTFLRAVIALKEMSQWPRIIELSPMNMHPERGHTMGLNLHLARTLWAWSFKDPYSDVLNLSMLNEKTTKWVPFLHYLICSVYFCVFFLIPYL